MSDWEQVLAELEKAGEAAVRRNLALGLYGTKKRPLVELWLAELDRQAAERGRRSAVGVAWAGVAVAILAVVADALFRLATYT